MKVLAWSLSLLVLILLASPVALLKGCGSTELCGGCPSDSIAPFGATITAGADTEYTVSPGAYCVNTVTFTVLSPSPNSRPMNNICVEVFTNGFIKLSKDPGSCSDTATSGNYVNYIRTRTDAGGTVTVDFATPSLACSAAAAPGDEEEASFFVQVSSCTAGSTWTGTWKIVCP